MVFESEESANAVLQSTHHTVNGKVVEVKRAVPRAQSSTAGSNPNSPAMMGYHPSSPSAVGGPGMLGKSAATGPKRPQRPRAPREMMASSNGTVPASPQQQRFSYAAVLRGRQPHSSVSPHGGGKPPQHHAPMPGRDDNGFRLHSAHGIPPGAAARAEAAAAQAFVRELKAWDVENSGQGLNFEDPIDCYSDRQRTSAFREYVMKSDMGGGGGSGTVDTSYNTGHSSWSSGTRASWVQSNQGESVGRQQHQQQQRHPHRLPDDGFNMLLHNHPDEDLSPRRPRHHSAFFSRNPEPAATPLYRSSSAHNVESYHSANHGRAHSLSVGHMPKSFNEAPNGRLLSPGEGGGTPALLSSSPLLGDGDLMDTAFADLKLDCTSHQDPINASLVDGSAPNGDGPSLLSEIGGGGPPSAASEVLPYGRAGGETALDGGGRTDSITNGGVWSPDAFGSVLGVNIASTTNDVMGSGRHGSMGERKDISSGGLVDHFGIGARETAAMDGATTQMWH